MRRVQSPRTLYCDVGDLLDRRKTAAAQELRQVGPVDQFHHQEHLAVRSTDVVGRDHVRVQQACSGLRLGTEPLGGVHQVAVQPPQQLHRDRPGQYLVLGLPDLACATVPQQRQQPVPPCEYLAVHNQHPTTHQPRPDRITLGATSAESEFTADSFSFL